MRGLPLIDSTGLTQAQRDGRECVSCRKRFPRPVVPVGRVATGEILYRCPECAIVLEPADSGPRRVLIIQSDTDRRP